MDKHKNSMENDRRKLFELLPGYACNCNCRFCSLCFEKRNINFSTKELFGIIHKAREEGFRYLGIGGGEPTIRKDLVSLIRFAKKLKFEIVRIETNGTALSYRDYCSRLADAGLDFIKLSVHGHSAKIHDYLTRVPGSFDNVMKAIDNLRKMSVRIEINTVLNKVNYRFYPEFVRFFVRKSIGSFCFIYPMHTGEMLRNYKQIGVRINAVVPYLIGALDLVKKYDLDKSLVFNIPPCFLPGHENSVTELSSFDARVRSPDGLIEDLDEEIAVGRLKFKYCVGCAHSKRCRGVSLAYLKLFGKSEFKATFKR